MKYYPAILPFLWSLLAAPLQGLAQSSTEQATIFDLLQGPEMLEVTLVLNVDSMLAIRKTNERIPAVLTFTDDQKQTFSWNLEINVRGNFRRMACDFPPLKLNFEKDELETYGLDKHNNLKLVTHCLDNQRGEDFAMREYLVYKMYSILSDSSYRVQLLKIKYLDTGQGRSFTRLGFVLEDEKELADRLNCQLCEDCYAVPKEAFLPDLTTIHDLFQYMIGNADWSPKVLRNLKLLKPENGEKFLLVPFDFDFSGIVAPDYAIPPKVLGIRSLKERVYLGFPHDDREFQQAYALLQSKKDQLIRCITSFDHLSRSSQKEMQRYVESFFKTMDRFAPDFDELSPTSILGNKD